MSDQLVRLMFHKHYGVYNPGEVAGFTPDAAQRLLAMFWTDAQKKKHPVVTVVDDPKPKAK